MVSVIVPAYNCQDLISVCIESLLAQSYQDIEILVIDDGSTDDTAAQLKSLEKRDHRIRIFGQKNGGPGAARNTGLEHMLGEYFTFVDADDMVEPFYIECMIRYALQLDLDYVISNVIKQNEKRRPATGKLTVYDENASVKRMAVPLIKMGTLNAPVAKLYRTKIQREHQIFMPTNVDMGEDLQFNVRFMMHVNQMGLVDENAYIYCTGNSILTKKYRVHEYDMRSNNIKSLSNVLMDNAIEDRQLIDYLYIKLMYAECMNMRGHVDRKNRKVRIRELLTREELRSAIESFEAEGLLQRIMKIGCVGLDENRIDLFAGIMRFGRIFSKYIKRASV